MSIEYAILTAGIIYVILLVIAYFIFRIDIRKYAGSIITIFTLILGCIFLGYSI